MVTELRAGPFRVRGVSLAGMYTALQVPELGILLDCGLPLRSLARTDHVFLSHTHADHAGGVAALLGIRTLIGKGPATIYLPAQREAELRELLDVATRFHHAHLDFRLVPMVEGVAALVRGGLWVRPFRTHHSAPSLGYAFFRKVSKLRPEHRGLPREEIARLRVEGAPGLFDEAEHLELAYATDTLVDALDASPWVYGARVLILECTYASSSRTAADARERGHLHLDELCARADRFQNEAIVLMHFSQIHRPSEIRRLLQERLPPSLRDRVVPFVPGGDEWFG